MNNKFLLNKRIDLGLSQSQIAHALGYSIQNISLWEAGKSSPNLTTWGRYASLLRVDLKSFILDVDEKNNNYCDEYLFDSRRFASNLRRLRKKHHLTQSKLASIIDSNTSSIIRYEKGESFPSLEQFIALVNYYHLDVNELYFGFLLSSKEEDKPKKKILIPILIPIIVVSSGGAATGAILISRAAKKKNNTNDDNALISHSDNSKEDSSDTSSHEPPKIEDGLIKYGYYPQSYVSDTSLVSQLELLDSPNELGYYSYNDEYYYKETSHLLGEDDRVDGGLFFNDNTPIEDNTPYWFKVEPIKWRIFSEVTTSYTLFADVILDATLYSSGEGKSNNYSTSNLRNFLNNDFSSRAFFNTDLPLITDVDNSLASTGDSANPFICDNTSDRVFAPSRVELGYISGYDPDADTKRQNRLRQTSEYVRIKATSYADHAGIYWTRTPYSELSDQVYACNNTGGVTFNFLVDSTRGVSICPMIRILK